MTSAICCSCKAKADKGRSGQTRNLGAVTQSKFGGHNDKCLPPTSTFCIFFFFEIQSHCVALACLEFNNIDQVDFELKVILLPKCWNQREPPHLAAHLSF